MVKTRVRAFALLSGVALLLGSTALTPAALAQTAPAAAPPATAPAAASPDPAPAPAAPQIPLTAPAPVVSRIVVQGAERIEPGTVISYLPITPGQTATAERLDQALETLFRTGLFADVNLAMQGQVLVVQVVENPIINQVVFEGNAALNDEKLREEVTVRPRGIFTRARAQQDVQRIVELYRRSGRIAATVTPKIVELPQKRVDLVFEINEGPRTGVASVNFLGNRAFSDRDLRGVIVTEESRWYRFFSSNNNYDPDRIEYDRQQLREHYTNRGYYDFRVVSAVAELPPQQDDFKVTFTVDEGEEYRFGDLKVVTELERLDPKLLQALLPIQKGAVYQAERIEQAVDALTFAAGAAGFAFVDIRPAETPNRETNTVDVTFNVREGPRVYVERIDIVGNTRTLDPVIRREISLVEGDPFNRVLVDRSQIDVRRLGFFKDAKIEELPGSAPDRTVLQVQVEEQPTGELSFAAGYSSVDGVLLDVGVTERNFRGRGQDVRLRLSVGSIRQLLDFSFTEPRFLGRNLSAGVDLYTYRYDFGEQAAFDQTQTGAGLRLGFPTSRNSRLFTRYQLRQDEVIVDAAQCEAGAISRLLCDQRGTNVTSLLGYTFRWDRRNDPRRPTRGFDLTARQDLAGVGGDVNYLRSEFEGGLYYGFRPEWVLSATAAAGYVTGFQGDAVRINDRFFRGGNTFRGFETAGLGPRDITFGDALGGNLYVQGTLELDFPNPLPEQYGIGTALFLDVGTLGKLDRASKLVPDEDGNLVESAFIRDDLALRAAAGLSVFWDSPLGPIRFDFSQILAKEPYDRTETFRFSQTTRF
ncbi:MAG TPA: outer membrane protein assembly factor BamA [Caulobacteraceae bacterium]|jgi:outer membrane protein insertion porin family